MKRITIFKKLSLVLAIIMIASILNVSYVSAEPAIGENDVDQTDNTGDQNEQNPDNETDPGEDKEEPQQIEIDFNVNTDEGFEKVASTDKLDLYFHKEEIAIKVDVRDKSGNVVKSWRSQLSPKNFHIDENTEDLSFLTQFDNESLSLLKIDYLNMNRDQITELDIMASTTFQLKPELMNYENTGNGIKFILNFNKLNIRLPVSIEIVKNELNFRIPREGFFENIEGVKKVKEAKNVINSSGNEILSLSSELQRKIRKIMPDDTTLNKRRLDVLTNSLAKLYEDVLKVQTSAINEAYSSVNTGTLKDSVISIRKYIPDELKDKADRIDELIDECIKQFDVMKNNTAYGVYEVGIMPYFGWGKSDSDGYVFYPDGSGAISYYHNEHPRYIGFYDSDIYNPNTIGVDWQSWNYDFARLPVYGVKQGNAAFAAIITEGDYDASIHYKVKTNEYPISRVYSTAIFRRQIRVMQSNAGQLESYETQRQDYSRNVKYIFLTDDDADYSGMAKAYRGYLNGNNKNNEQLLNKAIDTDKVPLAVDFIMGIRPYTGVIRSTIPMTTYNQVKETLERFRKDGVKNQIYTNLNGWTSAGMEEKYPDPLNPSNALGGLKDLQSLTQYAKNNNIILGLQLNPVDAKVKDTSRSDRSKYMVQNSVYLPIAGGDWYVFSPGYIQDSFANQQLQKIMNYGAGSVNFEYIGRLLYYDYNKKYGGTRGFTAESFRNILKLANEKLGSSSVRDGNAYTLKYAERIADAPLKDSGYFFGDETVPFYQMVVHGSIPYSGTAFNLLYDEQLQKLEFAESGAMPYFHLTKNKTTELFKNEGIIWGYGIYSSEIDHWYDRAIEVYKEFDENFSGLWDKTMDKHEILAKGIKKVTYSDGTVIYFNYNDTKAEIKEKDANGNENIITVDPVNYKVVKGGMQ